MKIKCKEIKVDKGCCYVRFVSKKDVIKKKLINSSIDIGVTVRGEYMIADLDKKGRIIGIELLYSNSCKKKCQQ